MTFRLDEQFPDGADVRTLPAKEHGRIRLERLSIVEGEQIHRFLVSQQKKFSVPFMRSVRLIVQVLYAVPFLIGSVYAAENRAQFVRNVAGDGRNEMLPPAGRQSNAPGIRPMAFRTRLAFRSGSGRCQALTRELTLAFRSPRRLIRFSHAERAVVGGAAEMAGLARATGEELCLDGDGLAPELRELDDRIFRGVPPLAYPKHEEPDGSGRKTLLDRAAADARAARDETPRAGEPIASTFEGRSLAGSGVADA